MPDTRDLTRTAALFAGNYLSKKSKALEVEELVKVLAQSFTLDWVIDMLNGYTKDPSMGISFLKSYSNAIILLAATAATDLVYGRLLELWDDKKMEVTRKDIMEALYQGIVVALGHVAALY